MRAPHDPRHPRRGTTRRHFAAAAAATLASAAGLPARAQPAVAAQPALPRLRERGRLVVGVYHDMPPFHVAGAGIDVAIAQALAQALGLPLSLLPFHADESMDDDLRNMVWRGHYLGIGPADVLLHVPVDRPLMAANPRVEIFAPYYRERVMIARRIETTPQMDTLADFGGGRIAVPGRSLAGWLLIGADGGRWRDQLVTTPDDGTEAARMLQRGDVVGAAGLASELECVLAGDARYTIDPLPMPQMRNGWAIGCAVRRESTDLAQAVQAAMNDLAAQGTLERSFAAAGVGWRKP